MIPIRAPRALLIAFLGLAPSMGRADLAAYFKKPEPAYKWEKRESATVDGVAVQDLHLVSQEWQGMKWEHRLQIFRPAEAKYPRFVTLLNTGGGGSNANTLLGVALAKQTGGLFAVLYNIPNQPTFGLNEDALIVRTWQKFMETGDETWPLHFPMAKAVLKAMDAIQEFSKQENLPIPDRFLITGASKRGWTTWLAGASQDPRIKAIAPMVIDTLNLPRQIPKQLESYGDSGSEQIDDYSGGGMIAALQTPRGKRLIELEDPYSYREILTLPKLLINGTNDRYWPQDALNVYWDDLKGPKWVLYVPNSGHGLEDKQRVIATLSAFAEAAAVGTKWPQMKWGYETAGNGIELKLSSDPQPVEARLFRTTSKTKDFRSSKWEFTPMQKTIGEGFRARAQPEQQLFSAVYGEAVYEINGRRFTLSTQMRILPPVKGAAK